MSPKPLVWVTSALDDLRAFPEDARRQAGYQLRRVQLGEMPSDWKPMPSVGAGVYEIRVHTAKEHRVFYIAKFVEAVYVLHALRNGPGKRVRLTSTWPSSGSQTSEGYVGSHRSHPWRRK